MARELSTDPYVPLVGSLPADAGEDEALAWVHRQLARHRDGTGFSFTMTDAATGEPVGHCGLWTRELLLGRAGAGYAVAPCARGRGLATDALVALTTFGWTVPGLERIELLVEPTNRASVRTAERAGYARHALLPRHQKIGGAWRDMLQYVALRPS